MPDEHKTTPPRRVRHKKRGTTYEVIGTAELQIATLDLVDHIRRQAGMEAVAMTEPVQQTTTKRRVRRVAAKPGQIVVGWGRAERWDNPDLNYAWGGGGASKPDGRLLCTAFEDAKMFSGKTLRQELEERGYDLTTLRFSIERKAEA